MLQRQCRHPIEAGVANSLARPGRNVTGNTAYAGWDIWGKLLELLKEAKPSIKRVAVLWTYAPPWFPEEEREPGFKLMKLAAPRLGLEVSIVDAQAPDRLSDYFLQIDAARPDALVLTSALSFVAERTRIMQFAIARRLPMIAEVRWGTTEPYPMLVYGASLPHLMKQAASYIVRIAGGTRPGDLPIQMPARSDFTVSLKTAKAIGLPLPQTILLRADQVFE